MHSSKLLLGCIDSLEKRNGVTNVKFSCGTSVSKHELNEWEQKNSCTLPDDLKSFYLTMDGFTLTWSTKVTDGVMPLGRMEINKLENLSRVQLSNNKEMASVLDGLFDDDDDSNDVPRFDSRSRIFELDHCDGMGKVCLVYMNTKPGVPVTDSHVWYMDRALQWHYLADSFTVYHRLMIVHLGLPQWQLSYTDINISPHIQQWFNVYAPLRLEMTSLAGMRPASLDSGDTGTTAAESGTNISSSLDLHRVFKGKSDKKKQTGVSATTSQKKKPLMNPQTGRPQPPTQRSSASSLQSLSSNKPRS